VGVSSDFKFPPPCPGEPAAINSNKTNNHPLNLDAAGKGRRMLSRRWHRPLLLPPLFNSVTLTTPLDSALAK
jgi:hypothetical protein